MRRADAGSMLSVAAIWGASYLFIRVGAPEFGAAAMGGVRAVAAALLLLPLLVWRGQIGALRRHWRGIGFIGVTNAALPFLLFNFAALTIPAGLSSILSATTPLFAALIGAIWLGERLTITRMAGLSLGFGGVVLLVAGKLHFLPQHDMLRTMLASLACLAATLLYGISGNFSKRYLAEVPPLAVAGGSQMVAAVLLLGPAVVLWPAEPPSAKAWGAVLALAALCTTFAYVLFFGLIARLGASKAMSALFLIPAFGVLWGCLFLGEIFSLQMGLSCLVILAGCALTTGLLEPSRWTVPFTTRRA
ncbi:Threonine/homoserine efflux transporter RhtA [Duganella sp. CF458]|uniref:DMT family transporter n=1 Tax=Duganella sp. CF458 TaxID=1884368 RepID=UPI0008E256D7|nr:EamA family transporter [Duganella sp. CF458]SFF91196.1 Threonine/homoserine efflux transporter RhtA [Duganella sp. CF458]